jgi:hypothetical protein
MAFSIKDYRHEMAKVHAQYCRDEVPPTPPGYVWALMPVSTTEPARTA